MRDIQGIFRCRRPLNVGLRLGILFVLLAEWAIAQQDRAIGDWIAFGGDAGSTKYSGLDQVTAGNVTDLDIVW
ncbi:MAG: hypothetical protein IIB38_14580, partial [Candidatus Hydrogenedentes bacterium]|nr:hypothetical protein [Candidatus Hydrogenedentota bacterium]